MNNDYRIKTSVDDEVLSWEADLQPTDQPLPSVAELGRAAEAEGLEMRIVAIPKEGPCRGFTLMRRSGRTFRRIWLDTLAPVGADYTDYNHLYCRDKEQLPALIDALRCEASKQKVDALHLDKMVFDAAPDSALGFQRETTRIFLAANDAKGWNAILTKKSLKRNRNKAKRQMEYRCEHHLEVGDRALLTELGEMHKKRWNADGTTSAFEDPRRIDAYAARPDNKLLTVLRDGERFVAAHWGMIFGKTLLWHTPVINLDDRAVAPLQILLFETATWCRDNGMEILDFGLGDDPYKYRFSNEERELHTLLAPISMKARLTKVAVDHVDPDRVRAVMNRFKKST
ncbi:MAG: GNAT family N-acetyltransferase [Magnetococcales bacterium]|nr:GNAT family N-acetyltransferase [Magnetococcales bacterium]